jgi:hypothetical protein
MGWRCSGQGEFLLGGRYHYDMNTRDTLETRLNVLLDLDPVLNATYRKAPYVMLGQPGPQGAGQGAGPNGGTPALVVLDTMNFWMDSAMDEVEEVIARVDILTINDAEARQLSGEHSLVKAAHAILAMGPKYLVVKKGEHGALLFSKDGCSSPRRCPWRTCDRPTGAGDTFAGGFIGYLARTQDHSFDNLKRAIIVGSAHGQFTCEKFGVERLLEIEREDIDERIQQFVELVDFDIELVQG